MTVTKSLRSLDTPYSRDAERAHAAYEALREALRVRRRATIVVAAALYALRDSWALLGYSSLEELCAQPEISLLPSTARRYIRLYEVLVVEGGLSEEELEGLSTDRLQLLRAVPPDERRKLLPLVRQLGWRDLKTEVREVLGVPAVEHERCRWWRDGRCERYTGGSGGAA